YYVRGRVDDVGELLETHGYEELNAVGFTYTEGKVYEKSFKTISQITAEVALDLIKKGYYAVRINEMPDNQLYHLPIMVLKNAKEPGGGMHLGMPANFFLSRNGRLQYAVINGYLINLDNPTPETYNQYIR